MLWSVSRVPSGTWKPGKPGDFNFIRPGPEIAWNLSQKVRNLDKTRNLAENLDKTWNVNRYKISILY